MTETIYAGKMPILALRGLAVFPEQTVHFDVGREKSVRALEAAMKADQTLFLIPQKDLLVDDPKLKDLYCSNNQLTRGRICAFWLPAYAAERSQSCSKASRIWRAW